MEDLPRHLVRVDDFPLQKVCVEGIVDDGQIVQGTSVVPVRECLPRHRDAFLFPVHFLAVERQVEPGSVIHDIGHYGGGCQTVLEEGSRNV